MKMNAAQLSSIGQFVAKGLVLAVALVLALEHRLTDGVAAVLAAALVSLGVTNGATLLSAARTVAGAFAPSIALPPGTTTITTIPPPAPAPSVPSSPPRLPPLAVLLLALGVVRLSTACAAPDALSTADHFRIGTEAAEQLKCVDDHPGDRAAIDTCRARVRAAWSSYWAHELDGGGQ